MRYMAALVFSAWALIAAPFAACAAPGITGQWQGVLHVHKDLRVLLMITKTGERLKAVFYSIDESPDPVDASITFDGKTLKIASDFCNYSARLSGETLKGTFCIGNPRGTPLSMDFTRVDAANGWAIPKPQSDTSPHKTRMVAVEKNVRLEVLDWGGGGRPLFFIHGLGGTAHDFDKFAARLTGRYHVYGVTRRGNGNSDKPQAVIENYATPRLGKDVLAVIDALKIAKPLLVGFSMGGTELGWIGAQHPEKVAGLIYLDAAYAYAYYAAGNVAPENANLNMDVNDLRERVNKLTMHGGTPQDSVKQIDELLNLLPQLQTDLRATRAYFAQLPPPPPGSTLPPIQPMEPIDAVFAGLTKNGSARLPVLAIYANPEKISAQAPAVMKADNDRQNRLGLELSKRFAAGNPKARIVYIADSEHDVFNSNPDQVEREMNKFIDGLR